MSGKRVELKTGDLVVYNGAALVWSDGKALNPGTVGRVQAVRPPLASTGMSVSIEPDGSEVVDPGTDGCAVVAFPGGVVRVVYPASLASGRYARRTRKPTERTCACGHRYGVHGVQGRHPCLNGNPNVEGASGKHCDCVCFRLARRE